MKRWGYVITGILGGMLVATVIRDSKPSQIGGGECLCATQMVITETPIDGSVTPTMLPTLDPRTPLPTFPPVCLSYPCEFKSTGQWIALVNRNVRAEPRITSYYAGFYIKAGDTITVLRIYQRDAAGREVWGYIADNNWTNLVLGGVKYYRQVN